MSTMPSPAPAPAASAPKSNRGLLIAIIIALLFVCLCIIIVGAVGAGLFISGRTTSFGQATSTPVAALFGTSVFGASPSAVNSATTENSPTVTNPPTLAATAVATGTPIPTPVSSASGAHPWDNWPVLLSDSFSSNTNGWNVKDRSSDRLTTTETIGAGKIHIEAQATQGTESERYPTGPTIIDSYIQVTAQRQSGPSAARYGLIFRLNASSSDDYFFSVSDDGTFRVSLYQGGWTNVIDPTKTTAINPGQANRLAVLTQGAHFIFYINDQQVGSADNTTLSSGLPGVAFELDANTQAVFEFQNFQVRAP